MISKSVRLPVFLLILLSLFFCSPIMGQVKDAGLWTSVNFEAKLVKKLTASISQEVRFNENITEVGSVFTDAGLTYKLNKHLQFSANYRFTQRRRKDDYFSFRNRIYVDIKFEKKVKPFQIQYRIRLQDQYADLGRAADGGIPEYYLRNKLSLKWNLNKLFTPYVSTELFSPLNYPRISAFDGIRASAGVEYEFSKHHKIDFYYMVQEELNVSNPETDFVVGLGYFFKL